MIPYVLYHHIITSMGPNITFSHRIFGRQELRQWALTSAPGQTQVALRKNHWGREQKYYAQWFCSNCSEGTCRFGGSVSYSSVAEQMTIRSHSVDTQGDWSRRSRSGTSSTLTRAMKLRIKQHMICCRPLRIYRQKEFYAIASRTWKKKGPGGLEQHFLLSTWYMETPASWCKSRIAIHVERGHCVFRRTGLEPENHLELSTCFP